MKEIGGYLELETLLQKPYYPDLIAVNNARNALIYILRAKKAKKVWLPYFLCDSVRGACEREGIAYDFYSIDSAFRPVFEQTLGEDEWLYLVNYYGQLSEDTVSAFRKQYGNIILDNVQAFFRKPAADVPTVYSCRKFFGVPDGGYAACDTALDETLPKDCSGNRLKHLLGRLESGSASAYYQDFKENDHSFVELELREMSDITKNLLGAIDYAAVLRKRNENFSFLAQRLGEKNRLDVKPAEGAYAYPFYHPNGMALKQYLAKQKIYVATLWPNVLEMDGTLEKDYAENILPLPCDQRYGKEDMEWICSAIAGSGI